MVLLVAATLAACGKKATPEDQVRAAIAQAAAAAEQRESATLRAMISERYSDEQGQDKRAIEGVVRVYLLRNESIHLFTRVRSVTLSAPDRAQALVIVAMAGKAVKSAEELQGVRADLYRFEITFSKEGEQWRVVGVRWQAAEPADFL